MIVLFTDFGAEGPYIGQMIARIRMCGFEGDVVNLFSDAPAYSVQACAHLLRAYVNDFPENSLFLCVVDPGVGSANIRAMAPKQIIPIIPKSSLIDFIESSDTYNPLI